MKKTANSNLRLESILGLTTLGNSCFSVNPTSGDIYYAAGCCVVEYSPQESRQKNFLHVNKPISCLRVSDDGRYLAVGERGHMPTCTIWDLSKHQLISTFGNVHKLGIGCLTFSPSGRYLVTVGFRHDRQLALWDVENEKLVRCEKLGNKVNAVAFQGNEEYFVTCGDRHLKFWTLQFNEDKEAIVGLSGKPASILEDHRNAVFVDVVCGNGRSYGDLVYCLTSTGIVCIFDCTTVLNKWIQVENPGAYCLSFASFHDKSLLVVGCSNGIIRVFGGRNLDYLTTLPRPCPLSENGSGEEGLEDQFPACLALGQFIPDHHASIVKSTKVPSEGSQPGALFAAIYANHSLFVWEAADIYHVSIYRSFLFHVGCVWDVQYVESFEETVGTFVTCSADSTIRLWNLSPEQQELSSRRSFYCNELLHAIDCEVEAESDESRKLGRKPPRTGGGLAAIGNDSAVSSSVMSSASTATSASVGPAGSSVSNNGSASSVYLTHCHIDQELPDRPMAPNAPRVLAVRPREEGFSEVVCGDRHGNLRVYDLKSMECVNHLMAHSAEVLTLCYSPRMQRSSSDGVWTVDVVDSDEGSGDDRVETSSLTLLASAGRDRLIHVFDATHEYKLVQTLDYHFSSVTAVRFSPDGKRFLSCGGDKMIILSGVNGPEITKLKSIPTPQGTINGLSLEVTNKFAVTAGQDKRLNVWNLQSGKHMRAYKDDSVACELYKTDVDPSGMYVAVCAFDKSVNIFDFFSGDLEAHVYGHSELITAVRFSPDGKYLLSVGGDGCIFVWKLPNVMVSAMQDRLVELYAAAQKQQTRVIRKLSHASLLLPAAAPPSTLPAPPPTAAGIENILLPPAPPPSRESLTSGPALKSAKSPSRIPVAVSNSGASTTTESAAATAAAAADKGSTSTTSTASLNKTRFGAKSSQPPPPPVPPKPSPQERSEDKVDSSNNNRWNARSSQEGYELFGKKIVPGQQAPNLNQFTLEMTLEDQDRLTHGVVLDGTKSKEQLDAEFDRSLGIVTEETEQEEVALNRSAQAISLAGTHENLDAVEQHSDADEDEEEEEEIDSSGDHLFRPSGSKREESDDYGSDFEQEEEDHLRRVGETVENLEKSAVNLESWLEKMIHEETRLDDTLASTLPPPAYSSNVHVDAIVPSSPPRPSSAVEAPHFASPATSSVADVLKIGGETPSPAPSNSPARLSVLKGRSRDASSKLGESLSSQFFQHMRSRQEGSIMDEQHAHVVIGDTPAVESSSSGDRGREESHRTSLDAKRRETASAVAQMKDRLRGMGVLHATGTRIPLNARHRNSPRKKVSDSAEEKTSPEKPAEENDDESIGNALCDVTTSTSMSRMKTVDIQRKTTEAKRALEKFSELQREMMSSYSELVAMCQQPMGRESLSSLQGSFQAPSEEEDLTLQQSLSDAASVLHAFQDTVKGLAENLRSVASPASARSSNNNNNDYNNNDIGIPRQVGPVNARDSVASLLGANQSSIYSTSIDESFFSRRSQEALGRNVAGGGGGGGGGVSVGSESALHLTGASSESGMTEANLSLILEKYSDRLVELVGDKVTKKLLGLQKG